MKKNKKIIGVLFALLIMVCGNFALGEASKELPGTMVLEREGKQMIVYAYQGGIAYFYDIQEGKYGLIDQSLHIVMEPILAVVRPFGSKGYAKVGVKDEDGAGEIKYGIIDDLGKWKIEPAYTSISEFVDECALAETEKDESFILRISLDGVTQTPWQGLEGYVGGWAVGGLGRARETGKENGRVRYLTASGEDAFGRSWEDGNNFSEGFAGVAENGLWGAINTKGELIIPYQYKYTNLGFDSFAFHNGLAKVRTGDSDNPFGYINYEGELVLQGPWRHAGHFGDEDELAPVEVLVEDDWGEAESLCGYINKAGEMVIPPTWEEGYPFKEGFAAVILEDNSQNFINIKGERAFEEDFFIAGAFRDGYAYVTFLSDYSDGYINTRGEALCQVNIDSP